MTEDSRVLLASQMITVLPRFGSWVRNIREFTTPYGKLGFRQLAILWAIRSRHIPDGELSPTSLATYSNVRPSVITRALTRLEEGGFLGRAMDQNDRRRINLTITQKGIEASEYVERLYLHEIVESMESLDDAEITTLTEALATMEGIFERLQAHGYGQKEADATAGS